MSAIIQQGVESVCAIPPDLLNYFIMKSHRKQILWAVISLLLALLSIWAVVSQSREMSLNDFGQLLSRCNPGWILLAIAAMFGYILFEGLAIWYMLRHAGYKRRIGQGLLNASADIYCAAITPSASGGQPVCAWFMLRDGIPMGFITAILALYLVAHTFATLIIGLATIILGASAFGGLTFLAKFLVILGYCAVIGLAVLFVALLSRARQIYMIACRFIDRYAAKGWNKRPQYWKDKFAKWLADYSSCLTFIRERGPVFFILLGFNLLQRLSQTLVAPIVYLAQGGSADHFWQVFSAQVYSSIGSMCMPIPGGMGVADYLLFNGLHAFLDKDPALQLELLSRSFSFYLCVILSLIIVVVGYLRRHKFYFHVGKKT